MDFKILAENILKNIGGADNVISCYNCMTRLRFKVADIEKVNFEQLKQLEGVIDAVQKTSQVQIIIGPNVGELYKMLSLMLPSAEKGVSKESDSKSDKNPLNRGLELLASIFVPIVPCLAATGIIKSFLSIASTFNWISAESETYQILYLISNIALYFLPFLIAVSAAKRFKSNEYFALCIAGALMYPTIMDATSAGTEFLHFLSIPIRVVNYSSSVIPILLAVFFAGYIQRWLENKMPKVLQLLLVAAIEFLIVIPVELIVFGPLGVYFGEIITVGVSWIFVRASILGGFILGAIHIPLVLFGAHYAEVPLIVQEFSTKGYTQIMATTSMSTIALAGAVIAVYIKTKNSKSKTLAASVMVPTLFSISEPALYGIATKFKMVLLATIIGGGVGGAIIAAIDFQQTILGGLGVFSFILFVANPDFWGYVVATLVTLVIAFLITYFTFKDENVKIEI
ncbi:MAG: PTS transporter subunit EIIC [Anaerolineaceae bacterium]|nr:PTS transporter subunit EIIC [Anaerolineaceae bacterium]